MSIKQVQAAKQVIQIALSCQSDIEFSRLVKGVSALFPLLNTKGLIWQMLAAEEIDDRIVETQRHSLIPKSAEQEPRK